MSLVQPQLLLLRMTPSSTVYRSITSKEGNSLRKAISLVILLEKTFHYCSINDDVINKNK